jgi:hypothetical protein
MDDEFTIEATQNEFTTQLNGLVNHLANGGSCYASGCRLEGLNPETDGEEIYLIGVNRDKLPFAVRNAFDNLLSGLSEFNQLQSD